MASGTQTTFAERTRNVHFVMTLREGRPEVKTMSWGPPLGMVEEGAELGWAFDLP